MHRIEDYNAFIEPQGFPTGNKKLNLYFLEPIEVFTEKM
jgi:hypothetical protein